MKGAFILKKKNKINIKRLIILLLIIIIVIITFIIITKKLFIKENTNIFKNINNYDADNYNDYLNYYKNNQNINKEDIVNFINYCSENSLDCNNSYPGLINFYKIDNFQLFNLNRYIDYINKKPNIELNYVIKIVNNNLETISLNSEIDIETFLLELIEEKYYKKDNLNRYVAYFIKQSQISSNINNIKDIVTNINSNLDYEFYENYEKTDITKDTLMIVNKHYKVDSNYSPNNLVTVSPEHGYPNKIRSDVYEEFKKMYEAAKNDNVSIFIASPYRSYYDQKALYDYYVSTDGVKNADTYSARPGFSEHHTGLAMDLIPEYGLDLDTFENSDGFTWMQENAYKYGFILRYPKDKEYITGYIYEPWHYRYVGIEAATIIKNENLTFEEYYEYYVK